MVDDRLINSKDLSKIFGVSAALIYKWRCAGYLTIPVYRIKGRPWHKLSDVMEFIESCKEK